MHDAHFGLTLLVQGTVHRRVTMTLIADAMMLVMSLERCHGVLVGSHYSMTDAEWDTVKARLMSVANDWSQLTDAEVRLDSSVGQVQLAP